MKREQEQTDDVKRGDVNVLEPVNHHRIDIVAIKRVEFQERKLRVEFARGEVKQVENDEREDNESTHDHVPRSPARFDVVSFAVRLRTGATIFDCEQNCEVDVQNHAQEKERANHPEQRPKIAQMLRVSVDPFRPEKNLQIS